MSASDEVNNRTNWLVDRGVIKESYRELRESRVLLSFMGVGALLAVLGTWVAAGQGWHAAALEVGATMALLPPTVVAALVLTKRLDHQTSRRDLALQRDECTRCLDVFQMGLRKGMCEDESLILAMELLWSVDEQRSDGGVSACLPHSLRMEISPAVCAQDPDTKAPVTIDFHLNRKAKRRRAWRRVSRRLLPVVAEFGREGKVVGDSREAVEVRAPTRVGRRRKCGDTSKGFGWLYAQDGYLNLDRSEPVLERALCDLLRTYLRLASAGTRPRPQGNDYPVAIILSSSEYYIVEPEGIDGWLTREGEPKYALVSLRGAILVPDKCDPSLPNTLLEWARKRYRAV